MKFESEMQAEKEQKPSMTSGILNMRCPSCRQSPMFIDPNPYNWNNIAKMNEICPGCGHPIDPEAGYYFGAMYFSYTLMVAWNFSIAIAIYIFTGSIFEHFQLLMILGFTTTLIISPLMFRYSRVLWSYLFFRILKK